MLALFEPALIYEDALALLTSLGGFDAAWIAEAGADGAQIRYTRGTTPYLQGLILRKGCGLGGKVFARARPAVVDDYLRASDITHDYDVAVAREGIRAMIAAPLGGGEPAGVVLAGYRDGRSPGASATAVVERIADHAALALHIGTRARHAAAAAARTERVRVADRIGSDVVPLLEEIGHEARRLSLGHLEAKAVQAAARFSICLESDAIARAGLSKMPGRCNVTGRECDVLRRVAMGETNAEIARAMMLSTNTVKGYLRTLMQKLGARNRVETLARARALGLIS